MTRPAPSTAAGSTRCPWCDQRFADDPARVTTTIVGREPTPGRPGYKAGRAGGAYEVDVRWHADCLVDFQAANDRHRAQVRDDRREQVRALAAGAGMDVAAALAEFDRLNA